MITKLCTIIANRNDTASIDEAATVIRGGGLVAFPTETVYGLGADSMNLLAIEKVFKAKGRPSDNPLIVHVADLSKAYELAEEIPGKGILLAQSFWPGPLTLVVRRTSRVPDVVTAGLDTVAIRVPNHPVALALLQKFGGGIVAPSANLSGRPSPTTAHHVLEDLNGRIDMILDAGPTQIGLESTVVDVTTDPPVILRKGGLTRERIEKTIGPIADSADEQLQRRSPGNRYRHYSPKGEVVIVPRGDSATLRAVVKELQLRSKKIACILHSIAEREVPTTVLVWNVSKVHEEFSHDLFRIIRECDRLDCAAIVVEAVDETGLGSAIMDRLRRAAEPGKQ